MPPLALHTVVAKEVADRLGQPALEQERGNLYLGSTAPDVRVITRWERERTHFFDLEKFEEQSGRAALFQAYPQLSRPWELAGPTVAFVCGYISHLVMDETWINDVYRPCFGEKSPLGGGLRANIMDRALQFSLDREWRSDRSLIGGVLDEVARCDLALDVGVIDGETLHRWRDVVVEVVSHPPDWERFRYVAGRHLREAGLDSAEALEELVRSLPDLVEETLRYLTPERIGAFMDQSLKGSVEAVREYLECA